jgi:hypothetical protein
MHRTLRTLVVLVVPAAIAASSARNAVADEQLAAAGFSYGIRSKRLLGDELLATYASSVQICATYCSSDAACVAFNHDAAAAGGPSCRLLTSSTGAEPSETVTSGFRIGRDDASSFLYGAIRGTDEAGVDRMGGDYGSINLSRRVLRSLDLAPALTGFARDAAACSQLCDRDARCRGMSVVRAGVQHRRLAVCYLKEKISNPSPNPDVHSSVKLGPPPV